VIGEHKQEKSIGTTTCFQNTNQEKSAFGWPEEQGLCLLPKKKKKKILCKQKILRHIKLAIHA
jgi:predicted ATP-binding protein involved in virulence